MFYIINTTKKHETLLYHVRTSDTKKFPISTFTPSNPLFVATPLLTPKIFKENTLKNTKNQKPTNRINSPLGVKFYSSLNTLFLLTIGVLQIYNPIFTAYANY